MARDILRGGACVPGVVALVPSLASKKEDEDLGEGGAFQASQGWRVREFHIHGCVPALKSADLPKRYIYYKFRVGTTIRRHRYPHSTRTYTHTCLPPLLCIKRMYNEFVDYGYIHICNYARCQREMFQGPGPLS